MRRESAWWQPARFSTPIDSYVGQGLWAWREDIDLSTFDKTCPQCGATNSAAAVDCLCGHIFNLLYLEDPHLALEQAAREELLIEEYLAARVEQATEVARAAVQAVLQEPESESKLLDATKAQRAARIAKAELVEQRARTAEARLRVHIAEAKDPKERNASPSIGENRYSWQRIIATEARKAESLQTATVRAAPGKSVSSRRQPGPAFKAAQAAKAESVVSEDARYSGPLSLTTSTGESDVLTEEAETRNHFKGR